MEPASWPRSRKQSRSVADFGPVTCAGCGLLCDDVLVETADDAVRLDPRCRLGAEWFSERMLRPAVMWRKQSLGSHSLEGCRFVERVMTALQTLRLTGRSAIDYFEQAIHALRHGLSPPALIAG